MDRIFLDQAYEDALDAAVAKLRAHNVEDGLLEGLAQIEVGERVGSAPIYPAVIVMPGVARVATGAQQSIQTPFLLPIVLHGQVQSMDTAEGYRLSRYWASRALHAITTDPVSGNLDLSLTNDIPILTMGDFEPPGPGFDPQSFEARARVNVRIKATF